MITTKSVYHFIYQYFVFLSVLYILVCTFQKSNGEYFRCQLKAQVLEPSTNGPERLVCRAGEEHRGV